MTATTTLQARLTAAILADPDVRIIYPTRSALGEIGARLAGAVGGRVQAPTLTVAESGEGTTVTVSVGITGEHPAPAVCRNLHDHIASELIAAGVELPLTIAVKVASIS